MLARLRPPQGPCRLAASPLTQQLVIVVPWQTHCQAAPAGHLQSHPCRPHWAQPGPQLQLQAPPERAPLAAGARLADQQASVAAQPPAVKAAAAAAAPAVVAPAAAASLVGVEAAVAESWQSLVGQPLARAELAAALPALRGVPAAPRVLLAAGDVAAAAAGRCVACSQQWKTSHHLLLLHHALPNCAWRQRPLRPSQLPQPHSAPSQPQPPPCLVVLLPAPLALPPSSGPAAAAVAPDGLC